MKQNNLSDSTEEVLYRLIRHTIYGPADGFRINPNYLKDVRKLTLEERVAHTEKYSRERDSQTWRNMIQMLLSHVDAANIVDVVDAGSGPGISAECIMDQFNPNRLVLVDATQEMLDAAKQRLDSRQEPYNGKIEYINGQVEDLHTLIKEPVDLVVMHWVIPYTKWRKQGQMLRGIQEKTLREGGILLFNAPYEDSKIPSKEIAIAQALAVHIGNEYGIPKLYKLGRDPIPTSSLTENVEKALGKAGFRGVSIKVYWSYLDTNFSNNPHFYSDVNSFVSKIFEGVYHTDYTDYHRLKSSMQNIVLAICQTLSGQTIYNPGTVIYVATK